MMVCGIDEAGRGPVMGPLVVGAVWTEDEAALKAMGAKDSKQLTPAGRENLYSLIDGTVPYWEVMVLQPEDLDSRMSRMNLNEIEMRMFAEAIVRHPSDIVYVDCPEVNTSRFGNMLSQMCGGRRVDAENKADVFFPSVSAASIMAKVTRDRLIEDLKKEFGCDIGSGYPSDPITMAFVEKWINENGCAPPHTRKTWKPVRNLMSLKKTSHLDQW